MTTIKVDAEIKVLGFEILSRYLGLVEAERFIALIQREKLDYTQWRQSLFAELSGEEISRQAMAFQRRKQVSSAKPQAKAG
ncbi:MAG: hypothetical protein QMD04_13670 [Anaerolineales bacterium]|nr:hypothetical protein [Anaerolineales bacterium]